MVGRFFVLNSCSSIPQILREALFFPCLHTPARQPSVCPDGRVSASPCPLLDSQTETPTESQGAQDVAGLLADLCMSVCIPLMGSCSAPAKNTKQSSVRLPEFRDTGLPVSVLFQFLTTGSAGGECAVAVWGGLGSTRQGKGPSEADPPLGLLSMGFSTCTLLYVKPDLCLETRHFKV